MAKRPTARAPKAILTEIIYFLLNLGFMLKVERVTLHYSFITSASSKSSLVTLLLLK